MPFGKFFDLLQEETIIAKRKINFQGLMIVFNIEVILSGINYFKSAMLSKTYTKYIQSLHQKKSRDTDGVFIGEGTKVVAELLQTGVFLCKDILCTQKWLESNEKLVSEYFAKTPQIIADFELEKISALSTPNEVLAIFEQKERSTIDISGKLNLMLDTIQDPGNLGTIIRIADWFGIENIICANGTAEMYNPKVVQSTMGSIARVNIIYTDLAEWLSKNSKVKVYAAALNGADITTVEKIKEGVIIIGNESKGISDALLKLADEKITIPRKGNAESLNAAVATGIILSHIC
ncbi:TrmH family RNA methyltransferase [Ferruginibacter sp. SUN002]|uniref:TrmH family RNA methyltransferase n=1 Tax=Ferruginibacter sp. SUN002 TaxID=2937789 RepID=UPI003D364294